MAEPTFATGELIALEMRNRRYGLIWVVGEAGASELCRVVGLEWFGKEPPSEAEAAEAELMHLTHHWYGDMPFAARLIRSPKPTMVGCGFCEVLPEWLDFDFASQQTRWKGIAATLYREYRWREQPKYRAQVEGLPQVGDTHAFELPEIGGWGAARVIATAAKIEVDRYALRRIVFGVPARWDSPPTLAEVEAARDAHGAEPRFGEIATTDELPAHFRPVGNLPPSASELAQAEGRGWGMWGGIAHSITHLWRLENDAAYATAIRDRRYGATFAVPLSDGRTDLFAHFRTDHGRALGLHVPARLDHVPEEAELDALLENAEPLWVRIDAPRPAALAYVGNAHRALDRIERREEKAELDSWAPLLEADRYASIDEWPRAGAKSEPPPPTLEALAARTFFESWEGEVEAKDLRESRAIVRTLHRALSRGADAEVAITEAVEAFNAIDHFIFTIEREDICDALWLHGRAAGLEDPQALVDDHRDW
jgi:hypothetical protein